MRKRKLRAWEQLEFSSLYFMSLSIAEDKEKVKRDLKKIEKSIKKIDKMIEKK